LAWYEDMLFARAIAESELASNRDESFQDAFARSFRTSDFVLELQMPCAGRPLAQLRVGSHRTQYEMDDLELREKLWADVFAQVARGRGQLVLCRYVLEHKCVQVTRAAYCAVGLPSWLLTSSCGGHVET
jgi:hypothetical protein